MRFNDEILEDAFLHNKQDKNKAYDIFQAYRENNPYVKDIAKQDFIFAITCYIAYITLKLREQEVNNG